MPHPLLQHQRFQHDCYVKDTGEGTSHQTVGQGVAYGGAKVHMESALQTLRLQGWIPMASALVGTDTRPPLWVTNDLRVTAGTSIDLTLRPHPLTQKEDLFALIAVAKALACSQGMCTWHLAKGY